MSEKKWFYTYIGLFYGLNILNTYFVTTQALNRYLVPFRLNGFLELNAILGNIAALSIILLIGFLSFKSNRKRITYLTIITLLLNEYEHGRDLKEAYIYFEYEVDGQMYQSRAKVDIQEKGFNYTYYYIGGGLILSTVALLFYKKKFM